jgi:hypothetical protein
MSESSSDKQESNEDTKELVRLHKCNPEIVMYRRYDGDKYHCVKWNNKIFMRAEISQNGDVELFGWNWIRKTIMGIETITCKDELEAVIYGPVVFVKKA